MDVIRLLARIGLVSPELVHPILLLISLYSGQAHDVRPCSTPRFDPHA